MENQPLPPPLRSSKPVTPARRGSTFERFMGGNGVWLLLCGILLGLVLAGGFRGSGSHALLHKPAPAFHLAQPDGTQVNLGDVIGKEVILLDFWASWCGPCRQGLPIIAGIARDYRDKGLIAYAVNVGETPGEVSAFLKESGLNIPVLLDEGVGISDKYGVSGIPQTVLIGRDGIVHEVHVGISMGMDEDLREAIDALLTVAPDEAST